MSEEPAPFYKSYLRHELERRCAANVHYSMRSFARALDVDPAILSRALSDKRALSYKVAGRIVQKLAMNPKEREIFLESVAEDQKNRSFKKSVGDLVPKEFSGRQSEEIDAEVFRIIGDWYHYAIRQLTFVNGFKSDARWIAAKLGISVLEAKLAVKRLVALGLMEEINGELKATKASLATKDRSSVTTPALRKHQKQLLEKAAHSMENDPIDIRSMTGMTMAVDIKKLPMAKKLITQFMEDLCEVMSDGHLNSLYQLQINLFPLEKNRSG